jgi:hypothetical protein
MLPCQGVVAERTVRYALLGLLPFPAQPRKSASDYGPVWLDNQDRPPVPAGEAHGRVPVNPIRLITSRTFTCGTILHRRFTPA